MSLSKETALQKLSESKRAVEIQIYNETILFSRNIARLEKERNKIAETIEAFEENL